MADLRNHLPECPNPACDGAVVTVTWQKFGDGRRMVRAECARCKRWLKFLPQNAANVALADAAERKRSNGWVVCECGEQSFIPDVPNFYPVKCGFCGEVLVPEPAARP